MIRFNQFSLSRGTKPLFEETSFTLNPGEKAGLVGANGAGKSTLFSVLRGELHADGGDFAMPPSWRIAHVAQETPAVDRTALDYTLDGDVNLRAIEARIAQASAAHDGVAEAEAHAAFADADGYTAPARAETLLLGLGFTLEQTREPVASFSGGWRMRLNLAQALMCPSDLLLLDEPTNHLDLDAIVWLEDSLGRYPGTLVVISYDREFLDSVCNVTLHLENRQIKRYGGNYSQFEVLRAQQLALQQSAYEKQQRTVAHLQSFIDRFKAKATKAKQAQSRVKALEKMELIAPAHASSPFTFEFREPDAAPNPMMVMEGVRCGYRGDDGHEIPIVENVTLSIQNGQRIGLLGANGQGKSTLIKTLAHTLDALSGAVRQGKGLQIGYFAQHQLETLRPDDSALQHLARLAPDTREQELRDFLGSFNFSGDMATAKIAPFSGGEKARLALIIWQKPKLLLLDEPTNHLDLETRHALTMALAQFEGTLILVSHDRHLLRATTDTFMLVAKHRLHPFDGDLDDSRLAAATRRRNARGRQGCERRGQSFRQCAEPQGAAQAGSAGAPEARASEEAVADAHRENRKGDGEAQRGEGATRCLRRRSRELRGRAENPADRHDPPSGRSRRAARNARNGVARSPRGTRADRLISGS
ncbi:Glutathione-regulated potassium-efflux system ATP-binding protein [Candidatus Burkholderia verschuerenii]|uniref:Probable ATP-binding protein YheS n=1 Tax=Candidatus Burkholderia verschuerenii TaxID=242163 RepID=A0A0L0MHC5_9BURK|nr:Glutathione-regulated potassium-efflux system ATP-binding protein [Candidatus Burkholderia verschuerenii]